MLHRRPGIPVAYMIFDVLEQDGLATLNWPYRQRRELLDDLDLHGSHWDTAMAFEDGERLFRSVREDPSAVEFLTLTGVLLYCRFR